MKREDEQLMAGGKEFMVLAPGSGKTESANLMACWRLMQTPSEGEDEPGGPVDERFTPVSEEELERRLAALNDLTVEPLPVEIEELSDSSRFLAPVEETQEPERVTRGTSPLGSRQPLRAWAPSRRGLFMESRLALPDVPVWGRHVDVFFSSNWEEVQRTFSTVLYVGPVQGGSLSLKLRSTEGTLSPRWFFCRSDRWGDMFREWEQASERRREEGLYYYSTSSWSCALIRPDQPLRDAVRNSTLTRHSAVDVFVDNTGASRDPNAALTSLIADATTFCITEADDGAWTLLVTAPAVGGDKHPAAGPPRLAVMELPGAPPGLSSARPPANWRPSSIVEEN
ncbi:hypothetical protein [Streptomyces hirsutus]|uniref:hypothetical protein n=1 Tax=Streptomyces hirsutus TaxID=35620 RepID=UPI0033293306